jgi:predicted  nucleic acid-binding Zn-ribbon protein
MRFNTLIFVTLLLSISMAIRMEAIKNAKFAKTKLGKFIVNFAELTTSLGQANYDPLFDALDLLEQTLEDQLANAQANQADAETIHTSLVNNYENNRDSANSDVIATQQTLANLAESLASYQNDIANANAAIAANSEAIVNLNNERADRVAKYNADVEDVNSGIDSIDEALALLRSLQTSSDVTGFIQLNDKALTDIKAKLHKSFDGLSNKKRTHYRYRPLLMAVIEVMNKQNFVNQDALVRVINLLVDLRASLSDYLAKLESDEVAAEENYNAVLEGLNVAVQLASDALSVAQENADNTSASIASNEEFLATRTADYNAAVDAIAVENDLWNQKVQAFNDLVDEINAEIKIVQEAVAVLNAGGITRSA